MSGTLKTLILGSTAIMIAGVLFACATTRSLPAKHPISK